MRSYPYIACEMTMPEVLELPGGSAAIFSCSSPIKTSGNEDCAAVISVNKETTLLIVADGLGGRANGAAASAYLVSLLEDSISKGELENIPLRESILSSIEKANLDLLEKNTGEGTTLTIAEINKDSVRTYHIGDSEILISDQKGHIKLQTLSHSPVGYAVEAGLIDEDLAIGHEDRHFVSNYVGHFEMHITIGAPVSLIAGDTLLLATDGLFDNLFKHEVIEIVNKGQLEDDSKVLLGLCASRMNNRQSDRPYKPDDLTFILYTPE